MMGFQGFENHHNFRKIHRFCTNLSDPPWKVSPTSFWDSCRTFNYWRDGLDFFDQVHHNGIWPQM